MTNEEAKKVFIEYCSLAGILVMDVKYFEINEDEYEHKWECEAYSNYLVGNPEDSKCTITIRTKTFIEDSHTIYRNLFSALLLKQRSNKND